MSTNPRGRNRIPLAPTATAPARLPPLPAGAGPWERGVVERLQQMAGERGNPWEQVQTRRDLSVLGLLGGTPRADMPTDQGGIPVWTSRERFDLVTLAGLGAALASYLTASSGEVSAADFNLLKKRVDAMGLGGSTAALQQTIAHLRTQLRQEIQQAMQAAVRANAQEIAGLRGAVNDAHIRATQGGIVIEIDPATDTWTCTHSLGYRPQVTTLNTAGEEILGDVEMPDVETVTITHGAAITGWVLLR